MEELDQLGIDRSGRRDGDLDVLHPQTLAHLGQGNPVEEAGQGRPLLALLLGLHALRVEFERLVEDLPLETLRLGESGLKPGVELLVHPGNPDEQRWFGDLDVLQHPGEIRAVPNLTGEIRTEIVRRETFGDVRKGQIGHHSRPGLQIGGPTETLQRPHHVALADHHTLGSTCGPGGVDQGGQGVGCDVRSRAGHGVRVGFEVLEPPCQQLVPAEHPIGGVIVLRTRHQDDVPQVGELAADLLPSLHEVEVLEDRNRGLAVVGDVLDLVGGECRVDGDRCRPGVDRGEVGDHVLGPVARHDGDELILAHTEGLQTGRRPMHDVAVLRPRHRLPVPVLPVDGRLVRERVSVPVERVDDGLSFDDSVDFGPFREHNSIVDHTKPPHRITRRLQMPGAYRSPPRYTRGKSESRRCPTPASPVAGSVRVR